MADILWLFELSTGEESLERKTLVQLISQLAEGVLVPLELLYERLEADTLEAAKVLQSAEAFTRKLVRMNTSLLYKQQKYNLLREESEGFAKLVCILKNAKGQSDDQLFARVVALIGYFDLDPNRVLDIIVDVYAQMVPKNYRLYERLLLKLAFPPSTVANVVGFKVNNLPNDKRLEDCTSSMMLVLARLVKLGLCTLEAVYPHLSPTDEETEMTINSVIEKIKLGALSASSASLNKPTDKGNDSATIPQEQHTPSVHDVGAELDIAAGMICDQKIWLTVSLLQVAEFDKARIFLERFPKMTQIPLVMKKVVPLVDAIADKMLGRIDWAGSSLSNFMGASEDNIRSALLLEDMDSLLYWLNVLGAGMYLNAVLISKVCRIAASYLSDDDTFSSALVKKTWMGVCANSVFAAMSLVLSNPPLSFEIWQVLKNLDYTQRFGLYGYWRDELYKKSVLLSFGKSLILGDIRRIMRRLTKENVRQYGRLIAKIAHSNPTIVFPVILDQIQAYDNLIQPVVDSLKYLTPLDFDVLMFALIDSLANPNKERLKEDGTNLSLWLQGLAVFTGSLFRKYHATVDVEGMLQYIVNQLRDGNAFDLVILSELIFRMGGIESIANLSDAHVEALAGGPLLLSEVLHNASVATAASASIRPNKRANAKLVQALVSSHLGIPLWILLARQRGVSSFRGERGHLKLIGTLLDTGHAAFTQYSSLITQAIREGLLDSFDELPSLEELVNVHHIDIDLACSMRRIWITAFDRRDLETIPCLFPSSLQSGAGKMALSARLMGFFWFTGLSDIFVPSARYLTEALRLKTVLSSPNPPNDMDAPRWRKERERAPQAILALEAEHKAQKLFHARVAESINQSRHELFLSTNAVPRAFLFKCVLPRVLLSPADAIFTAHFVRMMHSIVAVNWSTLLFYEALVDALGGVLAMMTEYEAHNFGRFLELVFSMTSQWHSSQTEFTPTSAMMSIRKETDDEIDGNLTAEMDYEDFRHWYFNLHGSLYRCVQKAITSSEYLSVKNSIIVLTRISSHFPLLRRHSSGLARSVARVRDGEKREDLKVLAARYSATLSLSSSKMVREAGFHLVADSVKTESGEIVDKDKDKEVVVMESQGKDDLLPPADATLLGTHKVEPKSSSSAFRDYSKRKRESEEDMDHLSASKRSTLASPRASEEENNAHFGRRSLRAIPRNMSPSSSQEELSRRRSGREEEHRDREWERAEREKREREKELRDHEIRERALREREREREREPRERERDPRDRERDREKERDREREKLREHRRRW